MAAGADRFQALGKNIWPTRGLRPHSHPLKVWPLQSAPFIRLLPSERFAFFFLPTKHVSADVKKKQHMAEQKTNNSESRFYFPHTFPRAKSLNGRHFEFLSFWTRVFLYISNYTWIGDFRKWTRSFHKWSLCRSHDGSNFPPKLLEWKE